MNDWRERIVVNPNVCHGAPVIRGTRVPVSVILDNLAARVGVAEIVRSYPTIQSEDIDAVLATAAEEARERTVALPMEAA